MARTSSSPHSFSGGETVFEMDAGVLQLEKSVDSAVTRLNSGRKEFEARDRAQLNSFQQTIERYENAAVGAAVECTGS